MEIREVQLLDYTVGQGEFTTDRLRHVKALPCLSVVESVTGRYGIRLEQGPECFTEPGGCFVAPAHQLQTITHYLERGRMTGRWVFLNASVNERYPLDEAFSFPLIPPPEAAADIHRLLDSLANHPDPCGDKAACYRLLQLLLALGTAKAPAADPVLAALTFIQNHYRQRLAVADLAAVAHMAPSSFYPAFRRRTGKTPLEYLNDYRLSVAAVLLETTTDSIGEIAAACGMEPFYFSNRFRRRYGCAPSEYRRI